jgi:ppGpp synthetase/RelA/SpoT-type nucleotidyltranferase
MDEDRPESVAKTSAEVAELLAFFAEKLSTYPPEEKERILAAAEWARTLHGDQMRASGDPYIVHPLNVASILVDIQMDSQAVIAALLHDVLEDTETSKVGLRKEFGREVESLVQGVTKISILRGKSRSHQHSESIRKMLFAMVKDIRVILIKLADKLHNMRTLGFLGEEDRKRIAMETLDIYAPLAGRLGISRMKDELEDLSLKHLQPQVYDQIRQFVADRKGERAGYLERVREAIQTEAKAAGIAVAIETRAKHFYSIYQKMKRRAKPLDEIYDMLGLRLLCETASECYELLGVVHKLWMPIEGRFKDYIAMPKSNRYQSLHTTVMGYGGKVIEIQIRTRTMHRTAENGIAAHWLYKRGAPREEAKEAELTLINKLREWQSASTISGDFLDDLRLHTQGRRDGAAVGLHGDRLRVHDPHGHRRPLHGGQGRRSHRAPEGPPEEHPGGGDPHVRGIPSPPGLAALREDGARPVEDPPLARAERAGAHLRQEHGGAQEGDAWPRSPEGGACEGGARNAHPRRLEGGHPHRPGAQHAHPHGDVLHALDGGRDRRLRLARPRDHRAQGELSQPGLDQGLRRAAHRGGVGDRLAEDDPTVPGDRSTDVEPLLGDRGCAEEVRRAPD